MSPWRRGSVAPPASHSTLQTPLCMRSSPGGACLAPDGGCKSASANPSLLMTENKAGPWRRGLACSSLSPPGKSLGLLSNQGNLANMADG